MRHRKAGLKLSRKTGHLNSMFRNLVTSLLKYERIRTTDTKAKELRRWADRMVTLAKRGDLHARRQALAIVQEPAVVHHLFEIAAERFGKVAGGYTRITKIGIRPGDAAPMTLVELIGGEEEAKKKKKGKKKTAAKAADAKKKAAAKAPKAKETAGDAQEEKTAGAEAKPKRAPRKKAAEGETPAKEASAAPAKKPKAKKAPAEKSE
jgi:large subunit ribosomal protein L17